MTLISFTNWSKSTFPNFPPTSSLNRSTISQASCRHSHLHFSTHISTAHPQSVLYLFLCFLCVSYFVLTSQFHESLSDFYPRKQFIALTTQLVVCSSIIIYFLVHALSHHVQSAMQGTEHLSQKSMVEFTKSSEGSQQEELVEIRKVR